MTTITIDTKRVENNHEQPIQATSFAATDYDNQTVICPVNEQECVIIARTLENAIDFQCEHIHVEDMGSDATVCYLFSDKPFQYHKKHASPIGHTAYGPQRADRGVFGYRASVMLWPGEYLTVLEVR